MSESCEYCHEVEKDAGHWCTPVGRFEGEPTIWSLMFGKPAPKELP